MKTELYTKLIRSSDMGIITVKGYLLLLFDLRCPAFSLMMTASVWVIGFMAVRYRGNRNWKSGNS